MNTYFSTFMNRLQLLALSFLLFIASSCQKENPQIEIEETATNFCEAFYNLNYPIAKEYATPSSLPYLRFLTSNIQQNHLDRLKEQGAAEVSIVASEMETNAEKATVICQIKNALIIHPIHGNATEVNSLQDTLRMIKENGKWLIRKDIPLQNEKQSRD